GVDAGTAGARPGGRRIAEVGNRLEESEEPETPEDPRARRHDTADERTGNRRRHPDRRRDERDLAEAEPPADPDGLHHPTPRHVAELVEEDEEEDGQRPRSREPRAEAPRPFAGRLGLMARRRQGEDG